MKKRFRNAPKRALAVLLALLMLLTAAPLTAFAADGGYQIYDEFFTAVVQEDGTAKLIGYSSGGGNSQIEIPETIEGHTVTTIGNGTFFYSYGDLFIPKTISYIEPSAFEQFHALSYNVADENSNYSSLDGVLFNKDKTELLRYPVGNGSESYTVPDGVVRIGNYAMSEVRLQKLIVPDTVKTLGDFAFYSSYIVDCSRISDSVTEIGAFAFAGCLSTNLIGRVEISENVTYIGKGAFTTYGLDYINVASGNAYYSSEDGVLFNKDKTKLYIYPMVKAEKTYKIPNSVDTIESYSFVGNESLIVLGIPSSVKTIETMAFLGCEKLGLVYYAGTESQWKEVAISEENNDSLLNAAVSYNWDGKEIVLPDFAYRVKEDNTAEIINYLGEPNPSDPYAPVIAEIPSEINGYKVTSVDFSKWGQEAKNRVYKVTIPATIDSILYSNAINLQEIVVDSANAKYSSLDGSLYNKDRTELIRFFSNAGWGELDYTVPSGVKRIADFAFDGCDELRTVTISEGVEYIGNNAFDDCGNLISINISSTVNYIGEKFVSSCYSIEEIEVSADNKNYSSENGVLYNKDKTDLIYYPRNKTDRVYAIPNTVEKVLDYAFDSENFEILCIPKSVTSIGDIFCSDLTDVYYAGTEEDWNNIKFDSFSDDIQNANIHYNWNGEEIKAPDFTYEVLEDGTITITDYIGKGSEAIIPAEIDGYKVTAVDLDRWSDNYYMSKLSLPSTLTTFRRYGVPVATDALGNYFSYFAYGLGAIEVDSASPVFSSENGVLYNKDKTAMLVYPGGKEDTEFTVPNGVETVYCSLMSGNGIVTLKLPASLRSINTEGSGYSLEEIIVDAANPKYKSVDGVLFEKVDGGLKLIKYPVYKDTTSYDVPKGTVSIADFAFEGAYVYDLVINIPSSVTEISSNSFNPEQIDIYGYSTYGGDGYWDAGITDIIVDSENPKYSSKDGVLFNKDKTELVYYPCANMRAFYEIPNSVVYVDDFTFSAKLLGLAVPKSVKEIKDAAFYESALEYVCYYGSEAEWNNIKIGANNEMLEGAKKFYNWNGKEFFTYNVLGNGTAEITGAYGPETDIVVPAEIDGYKVTAIADRAFFFNDGLNSVVVSNGIETIGKQAFYYCRGLKSVKLPNTLKSIGESAFEYCIEMTECDLPNSITSIGEDAFLTCVGLKRIYVPKGLTEIKESTFAECDSVTEVIIPVSVTSIDRGAFARCRSITDVYYEGTEEQWNNIRIDNTDYDWNNEDLTSANIHFNYVPSADIIASGYCGSTTQWKLDSNGTLTISGTGIVKNYNSASLVPWNKYADQIKSVIVEEGVTRIGEFAFYGCKNLTSVTLPESLKEINGYVFKNCASLTEITLPSGLTKIGDSAFYGTGLKNLVIPANVNSVGYYAFSRCYSLKNIEFTGNAPVFYSNAFNKVVATVKHPSNATWTESKKQQYGGTLTWVEAGIIDKGYCGSTTSWKLSENGVLTISGTGIVKNYDKASLVPWNKYADQIKSVVVEEGVTRIGEFAFYGCKNLTSVTLPESLKEINGYVFKNCASLTEITLPSGLTKIGDSAFYGTGLKKLTVPATVKYVGWYAFSRCYSLTEVEFLGSAPELPGKEFNMMTATVYYPAGDSSWNNVDWSKLGGTLTVKAK